MTARTLTSREVFKTQLRTSRRLATVRRLKNGRGLRRVAAIRRGGEVLAASVTGTTRQIPKSRIGSIGKLVKKYAKLMSSRMGADS